MQPALRDLPANLGHRIYVEALCRALRDAGHVATFLNLDDGRVRYQRGDEQRTARLAKPWPNVRLFDDLRYAAACRAELAGCDLLHEHFALNQWGGMLAQRALRIPRVLHVHSDEWAQARLAGWGPPVRVPYLRWLHSRFGLRTADAIVTVSDVVKERLVNHWGIAAARVFVLPNAVEQMFFDHPTGTDAVCARYRLAGVRVIAFIGSFHVWYDFRTLLQACAALRTQLPDIRLLLVGDGDQRPAIEALVRELRLAEVVTITGCIDHADIPALLANTAVAVLPIARLQQPFWCSPMKLFEYMAAGKSVVATRAGQIPEIVRDGESAMLVALGDVPAWTRALGALLWDDTLRAELGGAARRAAEHYTWPRYVERLDRVYEFALTQPRVRG